MKQRKLCSNRSQVGADFFFFLNCIKIWQKKGFNLLIIFPLGTCVFETKLLSGLGKLQSILWLQTDVVPCANFYRLEGRMTTD